MNCRDVMPAVRRIAEVMEENCDYLSELDARNGDGDLGITMKNGFQAAVCAMEEAGTEDFSRLFLTGSKAFNLAAPSTLGTILSFCLMGMAKALKGKTEISLEELAGSFESGLELVMEKAGSGPGEKTILDALIPAVEELKRPEVEAPVKTADEIQNEEVKRWKRAAKAARAGMQSTKSMRPVHGRAAYYGEKSVGLVDGGAAAGMLIVESIAKFKEESVEAGEHLQKS